MDQFHKSLNNFCFIKPLEGKEEKKKKILVWYHRIQNEDLQKALHHIGFLIRESPFLLF